MNWILTCFYIEKNPEQLCFLKHLGESIPEFSKNSRKRKISSETEDKPVAKTKKSSDTKVEDELNYNYEDTDEEEPTFDTDKNDSG